MNYSDCYSQDYKLENHNADVELFAVQCKLSK